MIDWTRVSELRDEVGADASKDITQVFLLEVSEALAELTNDTPRHTLEERLHFIRGCALNLEIEAFQHFATKLKPKPPKVRSKQSMLLIW